MYNRFLYCNMQFSGKNQLQHYFIGWAHKKKWYDLNQFYFGLSSSLKPFVTGISMQQCINNFEPTFSWLVVTKKKRQLFLFGRAAGNNLSTYYLDRCCVTGFCRVCDLNLCCCSVAAVSGTTTQYRYRMPPTSKVEYSRNFSQVKKYYHTFSVKMLVWNISELGHSIYSTQIRAQIVSIVLQT